MAGAILGSVALSKKNAVEEDCIDGSCPPELASERDKVKSLSISADVLFGVAVAGVATGLVLYFVEPKKREKETQVSLKPSAGTSSAGVVIQGSF